MDEQLGPNERVASGSARRRRVGAITCIGMRSSRRS